MNTAVFLSRSNSEGVNQTYFLLTPMTRFCTLKNRQCRSFSRFLLASMAATSLRSDDRSTLYIWNKEPPISADHGSWQHLISFLFSLQYFLCNWFWLILFHDIFMSISAVTTLIQASQSHDKQCSQEPCWFPCSSAILCTGYQSNVSISMSDHSLKPLKEL